MVCFCPKLPQIWKDFREETMANDSKQQTTNNSKQQWVITISKSWEALAHIFQVLFFVSSFQVWVDSFVLSEEMTKSI